MQRPCGFNDGYKRSVAVFRLNLSQRLNVFGFSARKFHLRMSRAETGNYLGKRRFIRVDARHSNWDGLQGGFRSKYRDI